MSTRPTTSASNVHRRVRCPGSESAERGLPDQDSEYSLEGDLLHLGFASAPLGEELANPLTVTTGAGELVVLSDEQRDLVAHARGLAWRAVEKAVEEFGVTGETYTEGFERELWLRQGIKPILSGHCDYWRYYEGRKLLIIIDAKFGFVVVDAAPLNWQLRSYALMGASEWSVAQCVVAIAQPRAGMQGGETLTMAVYDAETLPLAKAQLLEYREAWMAQDAPRVASDEACQYCKAKLTCDAYRARLAPTATLAPGVLPAVSSLSDEQFLSLFEGWKLAQSKPVEEMMKAEARLRIMEGRLPGYTFKENAARRGIDDVPKAFTILVEQHGIPFAKVAAAAKLSLGSLESVVREQTGQKAKDAAASLNTMLAEVIIKTQPEPSIVKADPSAQPTRLLTV